VIPVATLTSYSRADSFTTDTFAADADYGQLSVRMLLEISPGTDESVDVRWRNLSDSETPVNVSDIILTTQLSTGWVEYSPTTTDDRVRLEVERRTSPASNSSSIREVATQVGIQL
jgi:hypothetical protein